MQEEQQMRKPFGLLGNWFSALLALLLCGASFGMMYLEVQAQGVSEAEGAFLLRFGGLSILYGFALLVILWKTADKRMPALAGLAGCLLLILSFLGYVPELSYPRETHIWINAGGLGLPALEMGVLGYILLAGYLVDRFKTERSKAILLWVTGILAMAALWDGKASLLVVLLCAMAFSAVWGGTKRHSLALLLLLGAAALATLLYALRTYDSWMLQGKDLTHFNAQLLRIAGWILPSAKLKTAYGVTVTSLWNGAGQWGNGLTQLRELLPDVRFMDADFSLLYLTSWKGRAAFWAVMGIYILLLWQIYLRADKAIMEGDDLRGALCFGVFIRFGLGALFHVGYCFQVLPTFHSFMPFFTYVGQYQLFSLLELGLALRVSLKPGKQIRTEWVEEKEED